MSDPKDIINDDLLFDPNTLKLLTAPLRAYFSPRFFGMDNIDPDKPTLFVGNHTLFSIDYPLMVYEIYRQKGFSPRPLADHWLFDVPLFRTLIPKVGGVDGTPENCEKLMKDGQHLVVFPGGRHEALKKKDELYQLIWKQRTGFVRLAAKYGYSFTPFASKGPDSMYTILWDSKDIWESPIGKLLDSFSYTKNLFRSGEMMVPLVRGIGPTFIPRPERFYFAFGEPISTRGYKGKYKDQDAMLELRSKVEEALKTQIKILLHILDQDRDHSWWRRVLKRS